MDGKACEMEQRRARGEKMELKEGGGNGIGAVMDRLKEAEEEEEIEREWT